MIMGNVGGALGAVGRCLGESVPHTHNESVTRWSAPRIGILWGLIRIGERD